MLSARRVEDRAEAVLPNLAAASSVVDVGCGPGALTLGLARATGGVVLGVDAELS